MKHRLMLVAGLVVSFACANTERSPNAVRLALEEQDGGAAPACAHATCSAGSALVATCSPCASTVCAVDPYCCNTAWDETCVGEAKALCVGGCEAAPDGGADAAPPPTCAHPVCQAGGALVATCSSCAQTVCSVDAYCCNTAWDTTCVGEAVSLCGVTCP
jgi:hypothetical protein